MRLKTPSLILHHVLKIRVVKRVSAYSQLDSLFIQDIPYPVKKFVICLKVQIGR